MIGIRAYPIGTNYLRKILPIALIIGEYFLLFRPKVTKPETESVPTSGRLEQAVR